jgi:hypothetical protein
MVYAYHARYNQAYVYPTIESTLIYKVYTPIRTRNVTILGCYTLCG